MTNYLLNYEVKGESFYFSNNRFLIAGWRRKGKERKGKIIGKGGGEGTNSENRLLIVIT